MLRMSLRDQFVGAVPWPDITDKAYSDADFHTLADVALGDYSEKSARFLLHVLRKYPASDAALLVRLHHITRYGGETLRNEMIAFARGNTAAGPALQAEMIKEIHLGLQERGSPVSASLREWALHVSDELLNSNQTDRVLPGAELVGTLGLKERRNALSTVLAGKDRAHAARIAVGLALAQIDPGGAAADSGPIIADPQTPPAVSEPLAGGLAKSNQESAPRRSLSRSFPWLRAACKHRSPPHSARVALAQRRCSRRSKAERRLLGCCRNEPCGFTSMDRESRILRSESRR